MPKGFGERHYRQWGQRENLIPFTVTVEETDLFILARKNLSTLATSLVKDFRAEIQDYSARFPQFHHSLSPCDVKEEAPPIIHMMADAAKNAGVGPFAAVAGAIAECVGKELLRYSSDVIVENGGDIFLMSRQDRTLGIYAGDSPFTGKLALNISTVQMPCGICTSSGNVGHSLSFGKADAVIVLAKSTPLADAWATALANKISSPDDISPTIDYAKKHADIDGLVVIIDEQIGAWGAIEFIR